MPRPVIVGYVENGAGRAALKLAAAEADARQAQLVVVHELAGPERPDRYGPGALAGQGREQAREQARHSIAEAIRNEIPNSVDVELQLVTGSAAAELTIASGSADLVVVGVSTQHAVTAMILDTVTREVVNRAASPVLVVPESAADEPIVHIMCGVDRSAASIGALSWAAAEAARRGMTLMVTELKPVAHGPRRLEACDSPLTVWVRNNLPAGATTAICSTEFGIRRVAERLVDLAIHHHAMLVVGAQQDPFRAGRSVARVVSSQTRVPVVLVPQTWQPPDEEGLLPRPYPMTDEIGTPTR